MLFHLLEDEALTLLGFSVWVLFIGTCVCSLIGCQPDIINAFIHVSFITVVKTRLTAEKGLLRQYDGREIMSCAFLSQDLSSSMMSTTHGVACCGDLAPDCWKKVMAAPGMPSLIFVSKALA